MDENESNSDFNKVLSVHLKPITSHSRSDPDENVDLYKKTISWIQMNLIAILT